MMDSTFTCPSHLFRRCYYVTTNVELECRLKSCAFHPCSEALMDLIWLPLSLFRTWFVDKSNLALENLALRQQLATYKHVN